MVKVDICQVLDGIERDVVINSMVDHGNLVGMTIARDIIDPDVWRGLISDYQELIIEKINYIKFVEKLM